MQLGVNGVALPAPLSFLKFLLFHNYFDWSSSAYLIVLATNPVQIYCCCCVLLTLSVVIVVTSSAHILFFGIQRLRVGQC